MSSVKKPTAPAQDAYQLTAVDKFQIATLEAEGKTEKDPVRKNNILACINYIKRHGIPKQESQVLYAHDSKPVLESKRNYRKQTDLKGSLHAVRSKLCVVHATDSELMTGAGAGSGSGSGAGPTKSAEDYKAKPPTARELKELPKDMQPETDIEFMNYGLYLPARPQVNPGTRSRPMHQLYLQIRIPDEDGGSEKDAQALKIWNDTGCSTQVILDEDFERLLGFRPAVPAQNGKPARAAQPAREYKGDIGATTTHTASGLASRRKINALIRLCTVPDCSVRLLEEWQSVEVNIASDNNALRLSGNAMRKNIGFATPPGNEFLVASPSRRALAWQVLRFPAANKG